MISREQLAGLFESLGDEKVLSAYLSSEDTDPAARAVWRRRFRQHVDAARGRVEAEAPDEVAAFERALAAIEGELAPYDGFLPERGWVGFATEQGMHHAELLRAHTPEIVRWGTGPRLGPYLRNLKLARPLMAALVDAHEARIYVMRDGELRELARYSAQSVMDDLSEGVSKGSAKTSGVRGETKTDAAARSLQVETDRMLAKVAEALADHGDRGRSIVVGGTREAVSLLRARLEGHPGQAATEVASLHMDVSLAELREALKAAASELNATRHQGLVDHVVEAAHARGRAVLGPEAVATALRFGAVETLLVTRSFLADHLDEAEELVDRAISQGADVEEMGGAPAERLDAEAGGAAARLRFPLPTAS